MKNVKGVCASVIVSVLMVYGVLWANEECQKGAAKGSASHAVKTKVLKDAAAALQQAQPEIAKGLTEYIAEEEKMAEEWKARRESHTKLLKDSAAALQASHPDLAKGLQETAEGKHMQKDVAKKQDWKVRQEARVKLLKDAAAALQATNPDLAKQLQQMCVPGHKKDSPKGRHEEKSR